MEALALQTPREVADHYRVHWRTVLRWIKDGLPAVNVGTPKRPDWRLDAANVAYWLRHRYDVGTDDARPADADRDGGATDGE